MADRDELLDKVLPYGSLAFGVLAVASPRTFLRTYGLATTPATRVITRIWGTRNIALAVSYLAAATPDEKKRVQQISVGLNAVDSVLVATADGVATSSRVRGAVTTAAFAALAAVRLTGD